MTNNIEKLQAAGVVIPQPNQVYIGDEIIPEHIEAGVTLLPGITLQGADTLLGRGSILGPGGHYLNIGCGRNVILKDGVYENCILLDGVRVRSGAEMRAGTLFMEGAQAAHTVGCKMTILGIDVILGSLINFCDIYVSGGSDAPFQFTEIGTGAVHYNFTPNALKFGSLIGPGAMGEIFGMYPRTFIGGQTQIIAPALIGSNVLIPAGTSVRTPVADNCLSIEQALTPVRKIYDPVLIFRAMEKFLLTMKLVGHYIALKQFFVSVRYSFAYYKKDRFLKKIYQRTVETIDANIGERLKWLFYYKQNDIALNFFAKLAPSLSAHNQKGESRKQQITEHQLLLKAKNSLQNFIDRKKEVTEKSGLDIFVHAMESHPNNDYRQFICSLDEKNRQTGKIWLSEYTEKFVEEVQEILHQTEGREDEGK